MDLNQLHYFITVAETGNITKAAQKLYITQPALSRAIGRLESELDVKLFDRSTNTLLLNDNGKLFLRYVSAGMESINTGVHAVRQNTVNRKVSVACYVFLDKFASFCDRCLTEFHDIDLVAFDSRNSVSDYTTDHVPDLVVIPNREYHGYTVVRAYLEPWCVMYHKDYQFRSDCDGRSISVAQLRQESIFFDNSPYDRDIIMDLFQDIPPNIRFAMQADESRTTINRCRAVGIVPVTAYLSLLGRVPDTPVRIMPLSDYRLERTIYLSHTPEFLSRQENYEILKLLDHHIQTELEHAKAYVLENFGEGS